MEQAIDLGGRRFLYFDSLHPSQREAERHAVCVPFVATGFAGFLVHAELLAVPRQAQDSKQLIVIIGLSFCVCVGQAVLWRWLCDEADRRGYRGLLDSQRQPAAEQQPSKRKKKGKEKKKKKRRKLDDKLRPQQCGWAVEAIADAPQQENGYDCGVFMLMTARSIALGGVATEGERAGEPAGLRIDTRLWKWGQGDMRRIRQRICADLAGVAAPT
eukprot:COSAG06_NODE_5193_length_3646_cov_8.121229_7_plen_215_part_00